jgi:hypothetical protein
MPSPGDLEQKIWYRLSKVTYIALYLVAFSFVVRLAYRERPRMWEDSPIINCNNGSTYEGRYSDKDTRVLCEYGTYPPDFMESMKSKYFPEDYPQPPVPEEKNYSLEPRFYQTSSWTAVFQKLLLRTCAVLLALEVLKRAFLYVAIGKRFFP